MVVNMATPSFFLLQKKPGWFGRTCDKLVGLSAYLCFPGNWPLERLLMLLCQLVDLTDFMNVAISLSEVVQ